MATRVLIAWNLVLLSIWMGVFGFFNKYFDGSDIQQSKVASLEIKLRKSQRLLAKADFKFAEYKDALASQGIKIKPTTRWTDPAREIASVISDPELKVLPLPLPANHQFAAAKKLYVAGDYVRAGELLENLINENPDFGYLPEASYLLSESYVLTDQIDRAIHEIDFLVTHFPETEFCAYGLLRLAKIFQNQEREDDAVEIYELVIKNFTGSNASEIAKKVLGEMLR